MARVRWHDEQTAGSQPGHGIANVEIDLAAQDVNDLLMRMIVRPGLMAGHQPVESHRGAIPGERLALHAFAHLLPPELVPVDVMDVHRSLPPLCLSGSKTRRRSVQPCRRASPP